MSVSKLPYVGAKLRKCQCQRRCNAMISASSSLAYLPSSCWRFFSVVTIAFVFTLERSSPRSSKFANAVYVFGILAASFASYLVLFCMDKIVRKRAALQSITLRRDSKVPAYRFRVKRMPCPGGAFKSTVVRVKGRVVRVGQHLLGIYPFNPIFSIFLCYYRINLAQ